MVPHFLLRGIHDEVTTNELNAKILGRAIKRKLGAGQHVQPRSISKRQLHTGGGSNRFAGPDLRLVFGDSDERIRGISKYHNTNDGEQTRRNSGHNPRTPAPLRRQGMRHLSHGKAFRVIPQTIEDSLPGWVRGGGR
jgi:hypothetical protein